MRPAVPGMQRGKADALWMPPRKRSLKHFMAWTNLCGVNSWPTHLAILMLRVSLSVAPCVGTLGHLIAKKESLSSKYCFPPSEIISVSRASFGIAALGTLFALVCLLWELPSQWVSP